MEEQKIWQAALGELELTLSRANFTTWFKNTFISTQDGPIITIGVPNTFTKAWLEKKYHSAILKALQKITDNRIKSVVYRVELKPKSKTDQPQQTLVEEKVVIEEVREIPQAQVLNEFGLNQKYSFDAFVIGKGNELAQAASLAAAQKPGQVYNPLFIYGGVGLGKTHLMQAVGNEIKKKDPNKKVLYVSCEKFTNDFVRSISSNQTRKFKEIYRGVDVLLIDDIQFLAGKDGTQEEFFHTFNELHQANKQVVITSDRPPKSIPAIESRLISRFGWGMIADISTPDLETRAAILKIKCAERSFNLNDEVITFIAKSIHENVRELEGALNKIIALNQLSGITPDIESVKKALSTITSSQRNRSVTPKELINLVAEFYDIQTDDILGACRKKNLALPRQIVMYLMREELKSSYPSIGQEIGNRDHTTAMHAHVKISQLLDEDEKINQDIKLIREKMYN